MIAGENFRVELLPTQTRRLEHDALVGAAGVYLKCVDTSIWFHWILCTLYFACRRSRAKIISTQILCHY